MRVLLLTPTYPRWPGDLPGASFRSLARALLRRGVAVRVVTGGADPEGTTQLEGISVRRVRFTGRGHPGSESEGVAGVPQNPMGWGSLLRRWRGLKTAVRTELSAGADLIHAHWAPGGLASPREVPTVLTIHEPDAALLRRSRIARALARPLFQRAAVVTTLSRQIGDRIQNLSGRFVGSDHIHPLPVDTKGYPWTRGGAGGLVIAPLTASARIGLALETVAVLASLGHDLPLTIIGAGPERAALERQASRLGVSALVCFAGDLPPDQTRAQLSRADLLLYTAQGESTALPVLEALLIGVPVIACWDSGAAVDLVPQNGPGRLSLPSPEALADNVVSLDSDGERLAFGRLVGEAWRARLAPDHVAELCQEWYRDALGR